MKTTALPTYEEIFGDGKEKVDNNFFALKREDKIALKGDFDKEYKTKYLNPLTGMREDTKRFKEDYNNLPDAEKEKQTLGGYVYNRHFRENYLPSVGYTYGTASAETSEPIEITKGRLYIDMYKANGDDKMVEEVRTRLKNAGFDLTKYSL